jgi:hypothetical protein
MWIDEENHRVHLQHGEHHRILTADHDPDPELLDAALENIENYIKTIDRWGETNNPKAVKAHLYEGVLYGLWAPFVNLYAKQFYGSVTLDNAFQYLYIFGESDAGKDKFTEFVLRLISDDLDEHVGDGGKFVNRSDAVRASIRKTLGAIYRVCSFDLDSNTPYGRMFSNDVNTTSTAIRPYFCLNIPAVFLKHCDDIPLVLSFSFVHCRPKI